jgi:hypothetical protein
MAWHLEDTEFVETVEVAQNVFAFMFEGEGRSVAVLAAKLTKQTETGYAVPGLPGVKAVDLFGNPVPSGEKLTEKLVYLSGSMDAGRLMRMLVK